MSAASNAKTDVWMVMDAAIECNNIGVSLLREMRLDEALETFKGAARMMYPVSQYFQSCMMTKDAQMEGGVDGSGSSSAAAAGAAPMEVTDDNTTSDSHASKTGRNRRPLAQHDCSQVNLSDNCFVLAEPLYIDRLEEEPATCTMESATIIYNMGLVYRLSGESTCLLQKAWSLFDMSFSVAFSVPSDTRSRKIAMACLNNTGEIQHALGNYQLSRQYLDTLYTLIISLPPARDETTLKERHQLLLNVMLLQEPKIASAA